MGQRQLAASAAHNACDLCRSDHDLGTVDRAQAFHRKLSLELPEAAQSQGGIAGDVKIARSIETGAGLPRELKVGQTSGRNFAAQAAAARAVRIHTQVALSLRQTHEGRPCSEHQLRIADRHIPTPALGLLRERQIQAATQGGITPCHGSLYRNDHFLGQLVHEVFFAIVEHQLLGLLPSQGQSIAALDLVVQGQGRRGQAIHLLSRQHQTPRCGFGSDPAACPFDFAGIHQGHVSPSDLRRCVGAAQQQICTQLAAIQRQLVHHDGLPIGQAQGVALTLDRQVATEGHHPLHRHREMARHALRLGLQGQGDHIAGARYRVGHILAGGVQGHGDLLACELHGRVYLHHDIGRRLEGMLVGHRPA